MHRSNFRGSKGVSAGNSISHTLAEYTIDNIGLKLSAQLENLARALDLSCRETKLLASNATRGSEKAIQAHTQNLAQTADRTAQAIKAAHSEVSSLIVALSKRMQAMADEASARKASTDVALGALKGGLGEFKGSLEQLAADLTKLRADIGLVTAQKVKKGAKQADTLASTLMSMQDKLDVLSKRVSEQKVNIPAPESAPDVDSAELTKLIDVLSTRKRVIRDQDGNITGWELDTGRLN